MLALDSILGDHCYCYWWGGSDDIRVQARANLQTMSSPLKHVCQLSISQLTTSSHSRCPVATSWTSASVSQGYCSQTTISLYWYLVYSHFFSVATYLGKSGRCAMQETSIVPGQGRGEAVALSPHLHLDPCWPQHKGSAQCLCPSQLPPWSHSRIWRLPAAAPYLLPQRLPTTKSPENDLTNL